MGEAGGIKTSGEHGTPDQLQAGLRGSLCRASVASVTRDNGTGGPGSVLLELGAVIAEHAKCKVHRLRSEPGPPGVGGGEGTPRSSVCVIRDQSC